MDEYGTVKVNWAQGYASNKIRHIDANTICYACGSNLKFVDTVSKEEIVFKSPGNGIATFATSPTYGVFALAESCLNPRIFICSFPSMEVVSILQGGTPLEFKLLSFSFSKKYLATYSGIPDFTFAAWEWETGKLLCKYEMDSDSTLTSMSFNPLSYQHIAVSGPESVIILNLEDCNELYTIKPKNIILPAEDGSSTDDREIASRSVTRLDCLITLPAATKAGLIGKAAKIFKAPNQRKRQLQPCSHCWSSKGEIYVGCSNGQLFKVDVETGQVTVLLSDEHENLLSGEVIRGMFNTLCLNSHELFAGGMDGVLRSLVIDKSGVNITTVCEFESSICSVSISPVLFDELAVGTTSGSIEKYHVSAKTCNAVSSTHFGQFVGAVFGDGGNLCISCREDGEVQVWEAETGKLISSISVGTKATSISASPSCSFVAIGCWTGHIYYIDIKDVTNLRVIERHRLHHGAVTFLQFSKFGNFLLSSSVDDTQIIVINAKPSAEFAPIGYIECMCQIENVTMATLDNDNTYISVVVTPSQVSDEVDDDEEPDEATSDRVLLFTLSKDMLENPDEHYQSLRKNFKDESINRLTFDLTVPLDSAVVTAVNSSFTLAGLGKLTKKLYHFKLPLSESLQDSTTIHNPYQEHEAHELSGGSLALSQHDQWLISYSGDGMIVLRDINSPGSTVSIQSHSFLSGGVLSASFSPDCQHIISVGKNDMSLLAYSWNLTSKGKLAMNSALENARSVDMQLRSIMEQEDSFLIVLPEWVEPSLSETRVASATSLQSEEEREDLPKEERGDPEGGEESQRPTSGAARSEITMTPTPVPAADCTWYDTQLIVAVKKENEKYDDVKRKLRKNIKDLRKTILAMMENNRLKPEIEQLDEEEYNLDVEEQQRLQQEAEKRIQQVKDDIEFENLAQRYLKYLLQKECWDDMIVKGRAIKSFNTSVTVTNYPMREQTQNEIEMLRKVNRMRTIEIEELAARKEIVEITTSKTSNEEEEDEEEAVHPDKQLSLHGSLGPKYGGGNDLFHSQFDLHTREQKISQVVLVKDAIRRVKVAFNEAFASIYRNKEQEIGRAKEKNVRIREIIQELDIAMESVKDPDMDIDEKPEKVFTVADKEVTIERVLSKEQQQLRDIEKLEEEARIEAARGDNKRERALVDMMDGVLEVKKEDILKQDIDSPEFMKGKMEKDWTDEEKKLSKEYEKRVKDLLEEREKYRKNLENELKKLQQGMTDSMVAFDDQLLQLYNRKVKTEMVINQEELKILRLSAAILIDDEINVQEKQLNYLLAFAEKYKSQANMTEEKIRNFVDAYREVYDKVVAEDKMLDRSFKRDFSDIPLSLVDQLYKLFKRRPRVQRQHVIDPTAKSYNPFGLTQATSLHSEVTKLTLEALVDMDEIENAPEGTDPLVWQRLCTSRKGKVESELRVKECAVILAGMTQYLQRRQEENEMLSREIDDVTKQLNKLCEDRMKNNLNLQIQFLLKQGQIEVETGDFIPDYSESILIHRGVVEDLNGSIRGLGESKIAAMTESKDFKKGIHQLEWERKRMIMQMEDLHNKARHIQMLKLTKDLQLYLNEENYHARQSKQIAVLEKTLELQDEHLKKYLSQKQEMISELERTIRQKEIENHKLERELHELHVSVSERKNISDVNATERAKNTADKRLRGIVQRRKLVDLAKAQAQEVAVLRAEVERLRMKTFPALVQVER